MLNNNFKGKEREEISEYYSESVKPNLKMTKDDVFEC